MPEIPEAMRRAGDRVEKLLLADRVPPAIETVMRILAVASNQHLEQCDRCRQVVEREMSGGRAPSREELCEKLVEWWEALGRLGALVVDPDTGELGPYAKRVES